MRPPSLLVPLLVAVAVALAWTHSGEIGERAEAALGKEMPAREAALAQGFVLGEDDRVDPGTKEDFRRSGLGHLLAVSGQNVALLGLLALPVLGALGLPLRARLLWLLGLIAAYVPLAGAGPSIQRAGIMGGLSLMATLAGRRGSSLYALLLAVVVTLAVDPRIAVDVGWQLSFAAVLGILLLATPLRDSLGGRLGTRGWRRPLVDGAAMTIAATIATAPLIAFHFEAVSVLTLPANLLALPAVAPAMWLGMLSAAAGQVPGFPVGVLNQLNALLLAYIAQVAAWCGRPGWAYPHVTLSFGGLVAVYLGLAAIALGLWRLRQLRRLARVRRDASASRPSRAGRLTVARLPAVALALVVCLAWPVQGEAPLGPPSGLRVSVLDVGQGDAILLQPPAAPAILVDGGPPGEGLDSMLRNAGVDRLGAVILTHDQSDHAGGIVELLGGMPIARLLYAAPAEAMIAAAAEGGVRARRLARGDAVRSGGLRLDVLWPPAELLSGIEPVDDPNRLAIVARARWRGFSMLLTGDAEAEAVPLDPGPVDVLKLAHHGSDDNGLAELLERTRPRLSVISVGAANPFGHPTPGTLATLAGHGVRTLRTDRDGTVVLEVAGNSIEVGTGY